MVLIPTPNIMLKGRGTVDFIKTPVWAAAETSKVKYSKEDILQLQLFYFPLVIFPEK